MPTVQEQTHERIRGFRQYLHREAGERVWSVGNALRVHLNNFSVDVLRDYIALSRHQFELIEFVTQRTGMDTAEPQKFEVMNWAKGRPEVWIDRGKPRTDEVPQWELEMLEDMAWRAQAMGRALSKFESNMTISTPEDLMELSRHQCEMLNFIKTGSFRKVPRRRKARTISGGGATSGSEERIKILGEALKEYQGRIEIRTVREFIALSKHQCELAGLLFAEAESGQPVFQVVDYHASGVAGREAYGVNGKCSSNHPAKAGQADDTETLRTAKNQDTDNDGNPPLSPLKLRGDYGGLWAFDAHSEQSRSMQNTPAKKNDLTAGSGLRPESNISDRQQVQGTGPPAHHQRFSNNEISGSSCKLEPANKEMNHTAGSGLRPESNISDRQQVQGTGPPAHHQRFSNNEISGSSLPVPGYKSGRVAHDHEPAMEEQPIPLSIHGTVTHPTGIPAGNIAVSLEVSAGGEGGLALEDITGRDGRFGFNGMEAHAPPDNFVIRGELLDRVSQQPLKDARVDVAILAGDDERPLSGISDYRGRFVARKDSQYPEWFTEWDDYP